ncbi:alpha-L-rhamnosidase [Echinicola sp. 20G]|uniref:alpha-L-rhamnosidase n=1 Tax=Echinicola sp. 20G TaxID=2781961 RepID=UPI001910D13C|nr:alpha-L-rhamnosidase [Echinicola sp. 20G]
MKVFIQILGILVLLGSGIACKGTSSSVEEDKSVQVDFISNIDQLPRFSWPGSNQAYFQILIQKEGKIIWKGKKEKSTDHTDIMYAGPDLSSGEQYTVKVSTWDEKEIILDTYANSFYAPLDYPEDWNGTWISYDYHPDSALPVFQKTFKQDRSRTLANARLYIAAPGFYEASINGQKIGKHVLDPAQTNYEDYTFYTAFDLDPMQLKDQNILQIMLGNGWYNQNVVWGKSMIYGHPVFIAQLVLQYTDGSREVIETDTSWKWKFGPITFSNIYAGEHYDARKEVGETTEIQWRNALLAHKHPSNLLQQYLPAIQEMEVVNPINITEPQQGVYVLDMGQNITGWTSLKLKGSPGQEITLRFAEEIDSAGNIDPTSTGVKATKHVQTCKYIFKSSGTEYWQPRFTYHGFRYVEISGLKEKPGLDILKGKVLYSKMDLTGHFTSSEPNLNKLHELALWTIKGNMQGIPTDCPHREKCGWTGDAHAVIHALTYNMDARLFLTKYMFDMRSSGRNVQRELYFGESFHDRSIIMKPAGIPTMIVPGRRTSGTASPDWGTAQVQIPWYLYLYYGQKEILETFYPDMKNWTDYVHEKNVNGIITHGLGDWCPPSGNGGIECPVPISSSAFHILDVKLMIEAANVLGKKQDVFKYRKQLEELIIRFNEAFLDLDQSTYGSQTANALALDIGIVPEHLKKSVAASIVKDIHGNGDGFLTTGIFGLSRLFKVLSENGQEKEVYRLLTKKGYGSFAYMWDKYDATTLWEVLPVLDSTALYNGRSHSHPMQGGYDAWFYSGLGGINPSPDAPGFEKIIFKPYLTQFIKQVETGHVSRHGEVKSSWTNENGVFTWEITIPQNCTGAVYVPVHSSEQHITLNGNQVGSFKNTKDNFVFIGNYEAGTYQIIASSTTN